MYSLSFFFFIFERRSKRQCDHVSTLKPVSLGMRMQKDNAIMYPYAISSRIFAHRFSPAARARGRHGRLAGQQAASTRHMRFILRLAAAASLIVGAQGVHRSLPALAPPLARSSTGAFVHCGASDPSPLAAARAAALSRRGEAVPLGHGRPLSLLAARPLWLLARSRCPPALAALPLSLPSASRRR